MILFNQLVIHNCTDQTAQGPLNVKIIKEDNSSVFTEEEQLLPNRGG